MKKTKFFAFLLAGACACLPLTSCGDDDDDDAPSNPVIPDNTVTAGPHTVYETLDGNKVTLASIGSMQFKYNSENYAVDVAGAKINYETGKIVYGGSATATFVLNSMGYISTYDYQYSEDNSSYKSDNISSVKFTYDNAGQLTKVEKSRTEIEIDKNQGNQYTSETTAALYLTWRDGSINAAVYEETTKEVEDGQSKVSSKRTEYAVNFDGKKNQLCQYTCSYADWFDNFGAVENLAYVGLLGKAPAMLPMSVIETTTGLNADGTSINDSDSTDYSYTVDTTGKIQTESVDNSPLIYTYSNISLKD